jgi:uncharacterized protein (DUF2236 family)
VNLLQRWIVDDHLRQTGRHDQPEIFGGPADDPGLTGPGSVSWQIHSDVAALTIGGLGAIVMEILHPSVMAGVHELSSYREDPLRRGKTTFGYVVTTTFANTRAATRLVNAVKGMHARVNGVRPDGVAYRALDPELIGWVHTCIPWAVMRAYELYNRPLTAEERDRYLAEQAVIGRMGGASEIPETMADLEIYVEEMRPRLGVNAQTLEFFEFLMTMPFGVPALGPLSRPAHRFQTEVGMGLMPEWAQRLSGFRSTARERRALHKPMLHAYARTLRWAYGGRPPYAALAHRRLGLEADAGIAGEHVGAGAGLRDQDHVVAGAHGPARV